MNVSLKWNRSQLKYITKRRNTKSLGGTKGIGKITSKPADPKLLANIRFKAKRERRVKLILMIVLIVIVYAGLIVAVL